MPNDEAQEGYVAGDGRLYCRARGHGPPVLALHGGPDFDHTYFLPELDRLADSICLVTYDQRGRGRSRGDVRPAEITIESETEDVERVRRHFGLESVAVLGHSWGGLLALEYALRHPQRVSHLVLANTAPASSLDAIRFRQHLLAVRPPGDTERLQAIAASEEYRAGDLKAEADYYRVHFGVTLRDPDLLERLVPRLREHFTPAGVLLARTIEQRLYDLTWRQAGYDLIPRLRSLDVPALVLHGEHDLVPLAVATRIAEALLGGRLVVLPRCGHFAYLEQPEEFYGSVAALLASG